MPTLSFEELAAGVALTAAPVGLAVAGITPPTSTPPVTAGPVSVTVGAEVTCGFGLEVRCGVKVRCGVGLAFGAALVGAVVGSGDGVAEGQVCSTSHGLDAGLGWVVGEGVTADCGWVVGEDAAVTPTPVGSAFAVPASVTAPKGSASRAGTTSHARTPADGIWTGYEDFRCRGANLPGGLRVGTGMSAATVTSGGSQVAVQDAAEDLLTTLYTAHYRELVRLAAFLTGDRDNAEEVVQDAYVKVHGSWRGVRELDKAEAYLRTAVVNLSRSRLRHRQVVAKHRPEPLPDMASAETGAMAHVQRDLVLQALHALPRRQREAVVLRYYGDLTEAQTATAMGCSVGAVKSHTSRAMAALRPLLEDRP